MDFLTFAKKTVSEAAQIALDGYGNSVISYKDATQIVTQTDVACEKLITERIRSTYPDHAILGEENGVTSGSSGYCWYIDPIDGTTNFAYQIPLWGVSLALFKDGVPVLGVVALPATSQVMWAEKGKGAFCNDQKLSVNDHRAIENCLVLTCPNVRKFPAQVQTYLQSIETTAGIKTRSLGCCVANLQSIAMGASTVYMDRQLNIYDYAAAALIVEESGGLVTDFEGNPWWQKIGPGGSFILATNGKVHDEMLRKIKNNV